MTTVRPTILPLSLLTLAALTAASPPPASPPAVKAPAPTGTAAPSARRLEDMERTKAIRERNAKAAALARSRQTKALTAPRAVTYPKGVIPRGLSAGDLAALRRHQAAGARDNLAKAQAAKAAADEAAARAALPRSTP